MPVREPLAAQRAALKPIAALSSTRTLQMLRVSARGDYRASKARLEDMKAERDQALKDAREDRNKVMALLENQRSKSFWSRMFK